jgi:hypothetical protein
LWSPQLNIYGFLRITSGQDKSAYYHEYFLRGRPFLLHNILRISHKGTGVRARSNPNQEPKFWDMPWVESISMENPDLKTGTTNFPETKHQTDDISLGIGSNSLAKTHFSPYQDYAVSKASGNFRRGDVLVPPVSRDLEQREAHRSVHSLFVETLNVEMNGKQSSGLQGPMTLGALFGRATLQRRRNLSTPRCDRAGETTSPALEGNEDDEDDFYRSICMMPFARLDEHSSDSWHGTDSP